jgi:hypothetical protein
VFLPFAILSQQVPPAAPQGGAQEPKPSHFWRGHAARARWQLLLYQQRQNNFNKP